MWEQSSQSPSAHCFQLFTQLLLWALGSPGSWERQNYWAAHYTPKDTHSSERDFGPSGFEFSYQAQRWHANHPRTHSKLEAGLKCELREPELILSLHTTWTHFVNYRSFSVADSNTCSSHLPGAYSRQRHPRCHDGRHDSLSPPLSGEGTEAQNG